jgi:hypothetical protein
LLHTYWQAIRYLVAGSSLEAEYVAALEAAHEAVWMKEFISELGVVLSALDPMVIYCDNDTSQTYL